MATLSKGFVVAVLAIHGPLLAQSQGSVSPWRGNRWFGRISARTRHRLCRP